MQENVHLQFMPGEKNYNNRLEATISSITEIAELIRLREKTPHVLTCNSNNPLPPEVSTAAFRMKIDNSISLLNEWKKLSLKEESRIHLEEQLNVLESVNEEKIIIKNKKKAKRLAQVMGRFLPYPQLQHSQGHPQLHVSDSME
jgi:hypothetical protein